MKWLVVVGLSLALSLPPGGTFVDDDGNVHEGSIEAIAASGITVGCNPPTGDRFCPHEPVTRAEMATFLARALDLEQQSGSDTFVDDDGNVHEGSIEAIAAAGITVGCNPPEGDRFCPDRPVTRAEMATLLTRALDLNPQTPPPGFYFEIRTIDADLAQRMEPSWRAGCPVPLSDLRYVLVDYWGFDGREHRGELVVHADWADEIAAVFNDLFDARYPFEQIVLIDEYDGDDRRSMAANNTSAFNCRFVSGTTRWSEHAYGRAIDINPVQNPYVRGTTVQPPAGVAYVDRNLDLPGMIHGGDSVTTAFDDIGWSWGGEWVNSKDYQHFSATGR